ncbi:MAG: 3-hydroxyacyl-CoA dehydrogenase NAD-binding domain-containing protein [Alphaproteobacteria bacterium]
MTGEIETVGIVGAGLIGSGWAARCLAHGYDVIVQDTNPAAEAGLRATVERVRPLMAKAYGEAAKRPGTLRFTTELAALANTDFIQEAAPERLELKIDLFGTLGALTAQNTPIASSTSRFVPSLLQAKCRFPERFLVGHPFHPVYLMPLVEVVAGPDTTAEMVDATMAFYRAISMQPLKLEREIEGFIGNRLQAALWKEAVHCFATGVAGTKEIDDALVHSIGMRWAFMGTFMTYHLAGGPTGMRGFVKHFPKAIADAAEGTSPEELGARLIAECERQQGDRSMAEIQDKRDALLADLLLVFKRHGVGGGVTSL